MKQTLDVFETQILRAAIGDLQLRIKPALQAPAAAAALDMVCRLLAHALVRDASVEYADAGQEIAALPQQEQAENDLLTLMQTPTPNGAEPVTVESLARYLAARLEAPGLRVSKLTTSITGFSKQTHIVDLEGPAPVRALVLRLDQAGGPVESAAADELPILQLMHRQGIAVAEPLWADHQPPFGGTLLATQRIAGGSAYDMTGSRLGPEGPAAARELARVLGRIHAIPVAQAPIAAELKPLSTREHIARMVAAYEDQWRRHRSRPSPVLEQAFAYLREHIPDVSPRPVIVHGDASLRNLLVDEGKATGLLDWELWHVGDANEDLAYCRPEIEQVMPWAEFMAEYRAHGGGTDDPRACAYFGLFGALRNAVFGESCIAGFTKSPRPESRFAFAAVFLARKLIPDVARRLAELGATAR